MKLQSALALVALICRCGSSQGSSVSNDHKSWDLVKDSALSLVQGTLFINTENTYPHATCEYTKPNLEKVCKVTLSRQGQSDQSCEGVKIFAGKDRQLFLDGFFQIISYNQDRAILLWWDNTKKDAPVKQQDFKFTIVNMKDCSTFHKSFPIDKVAYGFFPALVLYNDKVDVVLNSKSTCTGAEHCQLSYSLEGKQLGGAKPYQVSVSGYALPVAVDSPLKGYFMNSQDPQSLKVLHVNAAGEGKELLAEKLDSSTETRVVFSNAYEVYGTCWAANVPNQKSTQIVCRQVDASGNVKVSGSVTYPSTVRSLSVLNLPKDNLLVAATGCDNASNAQCGKIHTWRISGDGKTTKVGETDGPARKCYDSKSQLEIRLVKNNDGQYCTDSSCLVSSKELNFDRSCYTEKQV